MNRRYAITMQNAGTLYIVATPIGNLEDLAPRATAVLREVDLVAAEDTRHTGRLLSHFGIETPQMSLNDHNEAELVTSIVDSLCSGQSVALVSDAGTPLISDPGYRLVQAAHERGIRVSPIPGPSAATAALSVSGLPTDRFCFEGFLPPRAAARRERLKRLRDERRTLVFFESVHRIRDSLGDIAAVFGEARRVFVGRELSKLHEQCLLGEASELLRRLDAGSLVRKGEFVLVVEGAAHKPADEAKVEVRALVRELAAVVPGKQAVLIASRLTGRKKNELYRMMLDGQPSDGD